MTTLVILREEYATTQRALSPAPASLATVELAWLTSAVSGLLCSPDHCSHALHFVCSVCMDWDIRLMDHNSSSATEGRVELCINNTYGTVCDDRWGVLDARVVCRQLGIETDNAVPFRKAAPFGMGKGPILLDNVVCVGTEASLMDCVSERISDCTHMEDAGVRCNGALPSLPPSLPHSLSLPCSSHL